MIKHILFTGKPNSGKTTLLKKIVKNFRNVGGFYTEEIRKNGKRIGFKIVTLDGKEGILAKKGLKSQARLGSYGINIHDLEKIGVKSIEKALIDKDIIVIDEIGKMELASAGFKEIILKALDSGKQILGTIHQANLPFLKKIKIRPDVKVIKVTKENRDSFYYDQKEKK